MPPEGPAAIGGTAGPAASFLLAQVARWLGQRLRSAQVEEALHALSDEVRSVFLYRISDGCVTLEDKPGFTVRNEFNDSSQPELQGRVIYREEFVRANMYRNFFERVLAGNAHDLKLLVAIDVNDSPIEQYHVPVFTFQRKLDANTILIPDVDFLHANFYIPASYRDATPWHEKVAKAVFAGSTTGGRTITASDVQQLAIPRLRSGVAFKDNPMVDFSLPRIVQCESRAVVDMIRALDISGRSLSWQEQFLYKFILSLDGNGATCSRVAVALRCNSVLMKYESPNRLFYFDALVAWRHYIPITSDADVEALIETEIRFPNTFRHVGEAGREFTEALLNRDRLCDYTRSLLCLLSLATDTQTRRSSEHQREVQAVETNQLAEFGVHIQDVGDVWGWPGEWLGTIGSGLAIEAISMVLTGIPCDALRLSVLEDDGILTSATDADGFCGARGQDRKLFGIQIDADDDWLARLSFAVSARFVGGEAVGPMPLGVLCAARDWAPLESFLICVSRAA